MTGPGDEMQGKSGGTGIGCASTLLAANTVLMGFVAFSFAQGPYSSDEQELWYRYGSLTFLLAGSVLPAIALFAARQSRGVIGATLAWMLIILLAFLWFAGMSGGGV